MEQLLMDVNWIAVGVGAVVAFIAGAVWYSDLMFGVKWRAGVGVPEDDQTPMMLAMVTQMGATVMLAWVVGILMVSNSLALIALVALTICGTLKANGLFIMKSYYAITVEVGFVVVMTAILVGAHTVL